MKMFKIGWLFLFKTVLDNKMVKKDLLVCMKGRCTKGYKGERLLTFMFQMIDFHSQKSTGYAGLCG